MGNEPPRKPNILVIGIGNAYRSDDAAGLIAARRVKEQVSEHCSVNERIPVLALRVTSDAPTSM